MNEDAHDEANDRRFATALPARCGPDRSPGNPACQTAAVTRIRRPARGEYPESYEDYVAAVAGEDAWPELATQLDEAERRLARLPEARVLHRYAPGKWSVKEVIGHVTDNERVFAYRALRFARGDETPLPNFDENLFARTGRFDARPMADLLAELRAVRAATVALFATFDDEALSRTGTARGVRFTVRAMVWVTVGHVRHHLDVLRDRYGID